MLTSGQRPALSPRPARTTIWWSSAAVSAGLRQHISIAPESPAARILILDNHDDLGGHAKRNEFSPGGRLELMNGGTLSIDSPRPYSAVADGLLKTLGVDPVALNKKCDDPNFYSGLGLARGVSSTARRSAPTSSWW